MNQNMITAIFAFLTRNETDSFYISFTINYDYRIKNNLFQHEIKLISVLSIYCQLKSFSCA